MRAAFAEPIVPYTVDSSRQVTGQITFRSVMLLGSKTKELAPTRPMKRSRARRVCAFRTKASIERRSFDRFLVGWPLRRWAFLCRDPLCFHLLNRSPQPLANFLFNVVLLTATVKRIQGVTRGVEWNVPAWDFCRPHLRRHQMHQNAIAARCAVVFSAIVHAGGRVFENVQRLGRILWRAPVSPILQESEFEFKDLQKIPFIFLHLGTPNTPQKYEPGASKCCNTYHPAS